jgi:hypothetical protein
VLAGSAERAAGLAADALEAAWTDADIAAVAAQVVSQREVMAAWLVDGVMRRSALRYRIDRSAAVDTDGRSCRSVVTADVEAQEDEQAATTGTGEPAEVTDQE